MVEITNNAKSKNLAYLKKKIYLLRDGKSIRDIKISFDKVRELHEINFFKSKSEESVRVQTDLNEYMKLVLNDIYEDQVDYLNKGDDFNSIVDWYIEYIDAFVNNEYEEILVTSRSNNKIISRTIKFSNTQLNPKSIVMIYSKRDYILKSLIPGKYKQVVHPAADESLV